MIAGKNKLEKSFFHVYLVLIIRKRWRKMSVIQCFFSFDIALSKRRNAKGRSVLPEKLKGLPIKNARRSAAGT